MKSRSVQFRVPARGKERSKEQSGARLVPRADRTRWEMRSLGALSPRQISLCDTVSGVHSLARPARRDGRTCLRRLPGASASMPYHLRSEHAASWRAPRARATSRPGVLRLPHPSWTRGYVPACAQSAASARRIRHGQRGPGPRERGPAGLGNLAGRNASSVPRLHSPHGALTWSTRPPRRLPARACPTPRPGSRNARSEDKADAAENLLSRALPVCRRAKCRNPFLKKKKKWNEEEECAKA